MSHRNTQEPKSDNLPSGAFQLAEPGGANRLSRYGYRKPGRLNPVFWLPNTFGEFAQCFIFIGVLIAGTVLQINLSAQILDARLTQNELEQEYLAIQRQNAQLTWQIAEHTSLDQVRQRAVNIGYTSSLRPSYAISPISDDTLAVLDATILLEGGPAGHNVDGQANNIQASLVPNTSVAVAAGQESEDQGRRSSTLAANTSASQLTANRIIENGVLEAVKVINGR